MITPDPKNLANLWLSKPGEHGKWCTGKTNVEKDVTNSKTGLGIHVIRRKAMGRMVPNADVTCYRGRKASQEPRFTSRNGGAARTSIMNTAAIRRSWYVDELEAAHGSSTGSKSAMVRVSARFCAGVEVN